MGLVRNLVLGKFLGIPKDEPWKVETSAEDFQHICEAFFEVLIGVEEPILLWQVSSRGGQVWIAWGR